MKDIDEMTDTTELLKKGIKNQLESATVTLQLVHQSEVPIFATTSASFKVSIFVNQTLFKVFNQSQVIFI